MTPEDRARIEGHAATLTTILALSDVDQSAALRHIARLEPDEARNVLALAVLGLAGLKKDLRPRLPRMRSRGGS